MWTPPGLGRNIDPEQQVKPQQLTGPIPPYHFPEPRQKAVTKEHPR
jgi:hypothetical protein